ncbi:MAG: hypothetical protein NVSMB7_15900 [Chitinophagaceae bacterium]
MKGYRRFIIAFVLLLSLYVVTEINRPRPLDWTESLSKDKKTPYGAYILYHELKDIFPDAGISSYRQPVYNQLNDFTGFNTAYLLIEPAAEIEKSDVTELLHYVGTGNYAFIAAEQFSKPLMDSLKFNTERRFDMAGKDSATINFNNPALRADTNYGFTSMTLGGYFSRIDTMQSVVLGSNHHKDVNFIKIPYGEGAFFIHTAPLCFSNYFMLTAGNVSYTAKALSYLPRRIKQVYWDEYYKLGPEGSGNPFRFILASRWLKWAFRISLLTIFLFIFFEMKRRQRVIPVIEPPRNSTLDFVQTVGSVYFNQHDNKNIALKKINYFMEFVRSVFYLNTSQVNDEFIQLLAKKSGVGENETRQLVHLIYEINESQQITDQLLVHLSNQIDLFYAKAK